MGMMKEFKEFALKGNVIDLAVGVVIGAAFGKIVGTLVEKIIMPVVGFLTGGIDFSTYDIALGSTEAPVQIGVGTFATEVINFLIIAFAIFMAVKAINTMKKKEEAAPQATPEDILLLREIRDSLKR
jgi:large conductance mechanosensitive channel